MIEVQNGSYRGEDDIEHCTDEHGRAAMETAAQRRYLNWLEQPAVDRETRLELLQMDGDSAQICSCFGSELAFGTAGIRGVVGPGLNRMNIYVVRRATQGLAEHINAHQQDGSQQRVVIAYDTRRHSREFSREAALILAANGIKALLFDDVRPTPELSFAIRELGCAAGIVITASHNPPQYNGYKVYGPDGGQAVSPLIDELVSAISAVDLFHDVKTTTWDDAAASGLVETIGSQADRAYLDAVKSLSLTDPQTNLKVVYTPLHGTGACFIPDLLRQTGFIDLAVVEEQMAPDPEFSTVESPNPEEPASFTLALELASREEAGLVMATDPDGDRVGCMVRDKSGEFVHLTGNQVGALLLEYLLGQLAEQGRLPENGVMIKTIVTGDLGKKVAAFYGVETVETLTGFKFIGEKISEYEETGERSYLFGYEESHGYLAGTFARDKDAVGTAFLLAEMAAFYKEKGRTLLQVLEELFVRHGFYREALVSIKLNDMAEADSFMQAFQEFPLSLRGTRVVERRDYEQRKRWDLIDGREYPLDLPRSQVLYYRLEDDSWFCVRPSGTEPKVKIYFSAVSRVPITGLTEPTTAACEADTKLERFKEAVLDVPGLKI